MKIQSALRQSLAVVALLSCLFPPIPLSHRAHGQDIRDTTGHLKLDGQSRRLTGQSRALGSSSSSTKLPQTILLGFADGEIKIEASSEKVTPPNAISFSHSSDGESWQVGNGQPSLAGATRGLGGNSPSSEVVSVAAASVSLDQLLGQSVFRGKSFLTPPPNSRLLSGKLTIRRAIDGDSKLDEDTIEIVSGNQTVLKFTFPEGEDTIRWQEISGLPDSLVDGLNPGEYLIRIAGEAGTKFEIEDQDLVDWIREPIDQFAELVGATAPSNLVYAVEHLLSQTDDEGRPSPYFCDALDLIDAEQQQSDFTRSRRSLIFNSLGKETEPTADASETGIAEIDSLRRMVRDGRWSAAKEKAAELAKSDDLRTAGLAKLYTAVIAGESMISSVYDDDPAADAFHVAIAAIDVQNQADAFRAHINFANYLSSKVQSRIYNFALQSATELQNPLLTSLWQWNEARDQYAMADQWVATMPKSDQAANAINQARHYVVMGDFVRNLQTPDALSDQVIQTADAIAKAFSEKAVAFAENEPITRGAALEVLTHIAYRQGSTDDAKKYAILALADYEQAGSLAGIESCHRTLGLIASRDASQADQAIRHFEVTLQISELLRQQIELNESGADRAGFFARHAYTNERLIELLVEKGEVHRALEVAEMAKARSFQDLLSQNRAGEESEDASEFVTLEEALEQWPEQTCAVEYFIGSRYAYAFCVLPGGEVTAHRLTDPDGKPLVASELVRRITGFLSSMELTAQKMYQEAVSGRGFDKTWQDTLHQFYQDLIPSELQESLAQSEHLVVIPHHVLHYFPFAALVTELDKNERGKMELSQPKFLIEHPIDITVAPSLVTYAYLVDSPSQVVQANAVGIADFENAPRLPGVETDLQNFREVFGDAVGVIVQTKPITESDMTSVFSKPGLLLIGTHGQNEADRPLTSFLLCNSGADHDGRFTALELFKLPIASDVVVLSACYSGLADRSPLPGDDLFGLQRAILQSGAKSIISGLWDVYDDTAPELVKSTMMHFRGGKTISRSLAESQRDFLKTRKEAGPTDPWVHPYFWAVYNCSGGGHSKFASR